MDDNLVIGQADTPWYRGRFFFLVLAIFFLILVAAALPEGWHVFGISLLNLFFTAVLIAAIYAVSHKRALLVTALLLGLPTLTLRWAAEFLEPAVLDAAMNISSSIFLGFVTFTILVHVFQGRRVTADTLFAAVCVYLLMALTWTQMYAALDAITTAAQIDGITVVVDPENYVAQKAQYMDLLYYSLVTLTTLGFGDITPVSTLARSLTTLEALAGQLYLTILVARLVGLHIAQAATERND